MKGNLPSNIEIIENVIQDEFIPEGFKFKPELEKIIFQRWKNTFQIQ